ncbi:MAG: hypothetical protein ILP07_03080 [Treponema sp.]|nr:hypothetical protein [Treponema sp.]
MMINPSDMYASIEVFFDISTELEMQIKKITEKNIFFHKREIIISGVPKEKYALLKNLISKFGKIVVKNEYHYFAVEDLLKYDFFYCGGLRYPSTEIELIDNEYEINGNPSFDYSNFCPVCKDGLVQKSSFRIKGLSSKLRSRQFLHPFWTYWIIGDKLKTKLQEAQLKGIDYVELLNYKNDSIATHCQIRPKTKLYSALVEGSYYTNKWKSDCKCSHLRTTTKDSFFKIKQKYEQKFEDFIELDNYGMNSYPGFYIISKKMLEIFMDFDYKPLSKLIVMPVVFC